MPNKAPTVSIQALSMDFGHSCSLVSSRLTHNTNMHAHTHTHTLQIHTNQASVARTCQDRVLDWRAHPLLHRCCLLERKLPACCRRTAGIHSTHWGSTTHHAAAAATRSGRSTDCALCVLKVLQDDVEQVLRHFVAGRDRGLHRVVGQGQCERV